MKNSDKNISLITNGALIAATYIVLTLLTNLFGLASGVIQFRLSEALVILCAYTPSAIYGITIGCLLSNIITGGIIWDVIFGTIATLIGVVLGYYLGKKNKAFSVIPNFISNTIIIPIILKYMYGFEGSYIYFVLTVGLGELVTCVILGLLLNHALKGKEKIFRG